MAVDSEEIAEAKGEPATIVVLPYTIFSVLESVSPSTNCVNSKFSSDPKYLTYNVIYSTSSLSVGRTTFCTFAVIPEISPVTVFPTNSSTYKETSTPDWTAFNFTA